METETNIIPVSKRPEPSAIAPSSLPASKKVLLKMLDLAANLYSRELTETESDFWMDTFSHYAPEEIEKAFRGHFTKGLYFPKPAEILNPIQIARIHTEWVQEQADLEASSREWATQRQEQDRKRVEQEREQEQARELRAAALQQEQERRRAAGELFGWADVLKEYGAKLAAATPPSVIDNPTSQTPAQADASA